MENHIPQEFTQFYLKDVSFVNLMTHRIFNVLIVANPYDAFMLEDDGRVDEKIFDEYMQSTYSGFFLITVSTIFAICSSLSFVRSSLKESSSYSTGIAWLLANLRVISSSESSMTMPSFWSLFRLQNMW